MPPEQPVNLTDLARKVADLAEDRRRRFYETLAHELTVCARAIWSDEQLTDSKKVGQLKWLNEVQHRVIGKLRGEHSSPDPDFLDLRAHAEECPAIAGHLGWALKRSYDDACASELPLT